MPTYHAKDILERDIEELEVRIEKNDRKFRDFRDEVRDLIDCEVERVIGKRVEQRIKKALGNDLNTLIVDIHEKLHELDGDCKEMNKYTESQMEEQAWWRQFWHDDYFGILEKLWRRKGNEINGRNFHGLPSRKGI